ncbi:hypothetical protein [Thiothrix subterranea]|uniref:Uncharacterized protein n=1 Tax=Thiothrix subterranea TaxID=2735563 RepID=A0AA51MJM5_9GAMM|nr:hypothetical protein [Thiothrix subterranea]MDQ5767720.1 hypothetical protein [Thiothrix subterranea]WML85525.1 hypothetical protein RCG00_14605 [Thiothrix subterranea]
MNETLEYLFFTQDIADQFIAALHQHDLHFEREIESVQGAIVLKIAEGVDDDLWDTLDDLYDELSEADQALVEAGLEHEDNKSTAGIYLQLAGGHQTIAQVDPDVMSRMLTVITTEEMNTFVDTIVRSVETPDDSPICKR